MVVGRRIFNDDDDDVIRVLKDGNSDDFLIVLLSDNLGWLWKQDDVMRMSARDIVSTMSRRRGMIMIMFLEDKVMVIIIASW